MSTAATLASDAQGIVYRNIAYGNSSTHTWNEWLDIDVRFRKNVHDIPISYGEAMLFPLMKETVVDTSELKKDLCGIIADDECGYVIVWSVS